MTVDAKHHRYFVAKRGEVLRNIGDEFGGVVISFPRPGVTSDKVKYFDLSSNLNNTNCVMINYFDQHEKDNLCGYGPEIKYKIFRHIYPKCVLNIMLYFLH